jgi:hypothetical protein
MNIEWNVDSSKISGLSRARAEPEPDHEVQVRHLEGPRGGNGKEK